MSDLNEILAVHSRWWDTAAKMDTPSMLSCYPAGDKLKMYNLNGFIYHGVDELAALWEYLFKTTKWDECRDLVEPEVIISGDMALLTVERCAIGIRPIDPGKASMKTSVLEDLGDEGQRYVFRGTEVYRRDSGDGKKEWRIWHNHYSVVPDESEPKPGVDFK